MPRELSRETTGDIVEGWTQVFEHSTSTDYQQPRDERIGPWSNAPGSWGKALSVHSRSVTSSLLSRWVIPAKSETLVACGSRYIGHVLHHLAGEPFQDASGYEIIRHLLGKEIGKRLAGDIDVPVEPAGEILRVTSPLDAFMEGLPVDVVNKLYPEREAGYSSNAPTTPDTPCVSRRRSSGGPRR